MRQVTARLDNVPLSVGMEMRIRHVSDTVDKAAAQVFGGDRLGHWNIGRINRILDAMRAPVVWLPIPIATRLEMARVGAPNVARAELYAQRGLEGMPPLSFVQMPGGAEDEVLQMMVDGHHRMLALWSLESATVPARILPVALADDVRIVEMMEVAVFPEPAFGSLHQAALGRAERGVA